MLRSTPIFSIWHSTTSPGFRNLGGSKPMPTPEGVPVAMMVPGSRVMPEDSSWIIASMPVMRRSVVESCRSSPFTLAEMESAGGKAISSAVVMQGPMGVKPSRLLPKYHCLWAVCTARADTSLSTV